ncbi:zeta toxin family protein [Achromobacter insuavis]|uniref:zeta toxin family protein n=1 Tax=Achromobacter insuavis TaxID=1287735 RepID=UPI001F146857|nr:zeta toxin family protein [Achromobacter insuavis]
MGESEVRVVILAGPNGSGKTSLIEDLVALGGLTEQIINPDEVRKSPQIAALALADPNADLDRAAQKLAYQRRQALIDAKQPFAFETVMSHPSRLVELQQLRDQGYFVFLTFIATNSPDINVKRVQQRVETNTTTGHDVPEKSIRERYHRTLNLLPAAIELADRAVLYDNSYSDQARTEQANISRENLAKTGAYDVSMVEAPERWVTSAIDRLDDRATQRSMCVQIAENLAAAVELANPVDGVYSGTLVQLTEDYFGLVNKDGDRTVITVHDRLMLVPATQDTLQERLANTDRAHTEIVYRPNTAPEIRDPAQSVPTITPRPAADPGEEPAVALPRPTGPRP